MSGGSCAVQVTVPTPLSPPSSAGTGVTHPHPQKAFPSQAFLPVEQPTDLPGRKGDRTWRCAQPCLSRGRGGGTDGAAAGHMWLPPALMLPTWGGGACDSHSASGEKWEACGKQEEETHRGEGNSKLLQPPLRKM